MNLPASNIAIADATCPSCARQTSEGDHVCASCGFGFELASKLLPYEAPPLRKFIDFDHRLSRDDIKRGHRALEKLRARFPQITLCTCIVDVPEDISITEFGFWLFNQSVPNSPQLADRRPHSILLTIDPKRSEAGLTIGYGLDPFIDDAALELCLKKIRRDLSAKNYGRALTKLCAALQPVLARGHKLGCAAVAQHLSLKKQQRQKIRHLPPAHPPAHPTADADHQSQGRPSQTHDTHA